MVGTIIPMVHGKRRTQRIPRLLLVHSLGSLVGGLSIGLLIGAVSSLFWRSANRPWLLVDSVVGFIAIGYSLTELGSIKTACSAILLDGSPPMGSDQIRGNGCGFVWVFAGTGFADPN